MCFIPNPKYNIKRMLHARPGDYRDNLYELCIYIKRSVKTVNFWMATPKGDAASIKSDALYAMADFFGCKPDELINRETPAKI